MDPHAQHQNGTEVDVRFERKDGKHRKVDLENHDDSLQYDVWATVDLISCFMQSRRVYRILLDTLYTGITPDVDGIVRHDPNHRNHFHVWIVDQDGPGN